MEQIKNKLLEYQQEHTNNLVRILTKNNACLDASDTGTGKTYSAIAACYILKLQPIIFCPKSVIATWKKVSEYFNLKNPIVVNYETIKRGKYYDSKNNKIVCPFIDVKKTTKNDKDIIDEINFNIFDKDNKILYLMRFTDVQI